MRNEKKNGIFKNYIPAGNGKVSILLYGNIGEGEKADPEKVVSELLQVSGSNEKIEIHINSRGGDVFSGMSIFNTLKGIDKDIVLIIDGLAASIAGVIAMCGKPVYMAKHSRLMLHGVSGGFYGNIYEMEETINLMRNIETELSQMLSVRCYKTSEEIRSLYFDGKDHWFTAQEALDSGLIDGIIEDDLNMEKVESSDDIYNVYISRIIPDEKEDVSCMLNDAYKKGLVTDIEINEMKDIYTGNEDKLKQLLTNRERAANITFEKEYPKVIKVLNQVFVEKNKDFIENELKLFAKSNFKVFKKLCFEGKKTLLVKDVLEENKTSLATISGNQVDRSNWTLEDYRKKAPKILEKNPELYERLLEEERRTNK